MPHVPNLARLRSQRFPTLALALGVFLLCIVAFCAACGEPWSPPEPPDVPIGAVQIVPDSAVVLEGTVLRLEVSVHAGDGTALSGRAASLYSLSPNIAVVRSDGQVEARSLGVARIVAEAEGASDTAAVDVRLLFRTISAGAGHTCGVSTTHRLYCWGDGALGRLGTGTDRSSVVPVAVATDRRFDAVSAGGDATCGLSGSEAYCWGNNGARHLGTGTKPGAMTPTSVAGGHAFTSLALNTLHACGVTIANRAFCWGADWAGQVGNGPPPSGLAPLEVVGGADFTAIATGWLFTCGVSSDGMARCWGFNDQFQLGVPTVPESCVWPDGTPAPCSTTPILVTGGSSFASVVAGGGHACALGADGRASCWGANAFGQRGDGTTRASPSPTPVASTPALVAVTAGDRHTCSLDGDGRIWCWGYNGRGALGTDATFDSCDGGLCSTTPVKVDTDLRFDAVSASAGSGGSHTCGVSRSGHAYCWGLNGAGQLGAGYRGGLSFEPLLVAGQLPVAPQR
ncbi:MAG: hypothetical protein OER90_18485 [Gemmatimonadota bacterium]|nr:hypothetical protein [Gemmatimonadota bacterium]